MSIQRNGLSSKFSKLLFAPFDNEIWLASVIHRIALFALSVRRCSTVDCPVQVENSVLAALGKMWHSLTLYEIVLLRAKSKLIPITCVHISTDKRRLAKFTGIFSIRAFSAFHFFASPAPLYPTQ